MLQHPLLATDMLRMLRICYHALPMQCQYSASPVHYQYVLRPLPPGAMNELWALRPVLLAMLPNNMQPICAPPNRLLPIFCDAPPHAINMPPMRYQPTIVYEYAIIMLRPPPFATCANAKPPRRMPSMRYQSATNNYQ